MPRSKFEVNSYHVLEIQTQPTLPETSALGYLVEFQKMFGFVKHASCTILNSKYAMRKMQVFRGYGICA